MKNTLAVKTLAGIVLLQHAAAADETYLAPVTATESEYSESVEREDTALTGMSNLYRVEQSAAFGTEVINEEEIEAYKPKDIFDLLNKATGLDMTYQGRKHPYFVNMRGGGSITYIVDGAILPSTSDRILLSIPMAMIESIEIVRTSTTLSLAPSIEIGASNSGSGTNIGFIVIRTKRPETTEGVISAYVEKANAQPVANGESLYAGTRFGDLSGLNGYIGGMVSRFDRPSRDSWFDGSKADSGMITGGLNYGKVSMNLMGYIDNGRFEMQRGVTTDGTVDTAKWYYDPIKTKLLSFDGSILWNENQITLFSASKIDYEQDEHNEYFDKNTSSHKHYEEKTQTYSLRHNAKFGNTALYLGGQYTRSEGYGPNLSKGYNDFETSVMGFSASIEQTLFDGDLVLDGGYRRDVKHIDHSTAAKSEAQATPDANSNVDLAPANVIALGALYHLGDTYTFNARYFFGDEGTSGDFDLETEDNSTLHAERQHRWEAGVEAAFAEYFVPTVTYFDVNIKNEKTATGNTYTDADGSEYYYYTEQDAHRKGVEVSVKGTVAGQTRYKLSWTAMIANETKSASGTSDSVGASTPKNIYSALVSHAYDAYRFNVSLKHADGYDTTKSAKGVATDVHLGDYTRVDANIARDFNLGSLDATATLYGRNLTDDKYATRYVTGYYYDRGLTVGAEVSLAF